MNQKQNETLYTGWVKNRGHALGEATTFD